MLSLEEVQFKNRSTSKFQLDHVFVRGLSVESAEEIQLKISDHKALFLKLSLEE